MVDSIKKISIILFFNTFIFLMMLIGIQNSNNKSKVNLTNHDYFRSFDKYFSDPIIPQQKPLDTLLSSMGLSSDDIAFFKMEWDEDLVSEDKRDDIMSKAFIELFSETDIDIIKLLKNQGLH